MKPHDFQVSNCLKNRGKIGWELTFIMTNMKPNPFGRYHIKVPLDSGPRSPSTLTSISGNGVNSRINHPPFPDCCPFGEKTGLWCLLNSTGVRCLNPHHVPFWEMNPHEILACCRMFLPLGSKSVSPISVVHRYLWSRSWPRKLRTSLQCHDRWQLKIPEIQRGKNSRTQRWIFQFAMFEYQSCWDKPRAWEYRRETTNKIRI